MSPALTIALNHVSLGGFESSKVITAPTPGRKKAFDLLSANLATMFQHFARRKTRVCLIRRLSPVSSMLERRKDIDWNRFYRAFPA